MSTNSVAMVSEYYADAKTSPTLIRLPEDLDEVDGVMQRFIPSSGFEGKNGFMTILRDGRQLEEVAGDDQL